MDFRRQHEIQQHATILRRPVAMPKAGLQAVKDVAELWLEQRYVPLVDFVNLDPYCRVVRFIGCLRLTGVVCHCFLLAMVVLSVSVHS